MGLSNLSPLLILYNLRGSPTTAERTKQCNYYSAAETTNKVEDCDLFYENCCSTGCCPIKDAFPWWIWALLGSSIFIILFCWCVVQICLKKRRKQYKNDNNEIIALEPKMDNSSESNAFVFKPSIRESVEKERV